jgi:16S rRNA (cytosine1402-N4)-methyltransferase
MYFCQPFCIKKIFHTGELHAFDMDDEAVAAGKLLEQQDKRFRIHHSPFSAMFAVLSSPGAAKGSSPRGGFVDGVLIDIGISSPQLDGARGFRPEDAFDSALDMRFDQRPHVESALGFVHRVGRVELASCIEHYGGEHPLAARRISDAVRAWER